MKKFRLYGNPLYNIVVIHGGPGAPGTMAPVARELSSDCGILEPLQTANSVEGQLLELKDVLEKHGELPVILIGSSWGAMLGFMFAAHYPQLIKKLIMIGSGSYEEKYVANIMKTRLDRLSKQEQQQVSSMIDELKNPDTQNKDTVFSKLGAILSKTDSYNPLNLDTEVQECQYDIYNKVWDQAAKMRATGEMLELGEQITCPVIAIHGDYDPHPAAGITEPLTPVLKDFQFILLKNCGHYPWLEQEARDEFYRIIRNELNQ